MPSLNKVILIGHLGQDPELRSTTAGMPVANFSVATSYKPKDREKETEWHRIVVWDKLAELCNEYLSKGSLVYIEGRINTRKWQDKDGNDRVQTQIVANQVLFIGRRDSDNNSDRYSDKNSSGNSNKNGPKYSDEIPF